MNRRLSLLLVVLWTITGVASLTVNWNEGLAIVSFVLAAGFAGFMIRGPRAAVSAKNRRTGGSSSP